MLLSVLVPVYNVGAYLEVCINSVICQTYSEYELILVDDGSTDNSGHLCDQYSMQYPEKISVIHTPNNGLLQARIRGLDAARGNVVIFLDADDCLRADALEKIAGCFDSCNCDMVLYNAERCTDFSTMELRFPFENGQVFEGTSKEILYSAIASSQIPNNIFLKAIRGDCATVPEHFLQLTQVKQGEDLLLSVHFITRCEKIVYLDQGLYHYRIRQGSICNRIDNRRAESIKAVHTELEQYIRFWNMPELGPFHNARKVNGWLKTIIIQSKNIHKIFTVSYLKMLRSMSEDPYFRFAYEHMNPSRLSPDYQLLAVSLYHRHYLRLILQILGNRILRKLQQISLQN